MLDEDNCFHNLQFQLLKNYSEAKNGKSCFPKIDFSNNFFNLNKTSVRLESPICHCYVEGRNETSFI